MLTRDLFEVANLVVFLLPIMIVLASTIELRLCSQERFGVYYIPPLTGGGIKRCLFLTSV